jgi:hypothetical protein
MTGIPEDTEARIPYATFAWKHDDKRNPVIKWAGIIEIQNKMMVEREMYLTPMKHWSIYQKTGIIFLNSLSSFSRQLSLPITKS